jgi:hypothetical protein
LTQKWARKAQQGMMMRANAGSSGELHTPALLHFLGRFCSETSIPVTRQLKSQIDTINSNHQA